MKLICETGKVLTATVFTQSYLHSHCYERTSAFKDPIDQWLFYSGFVVLQIVSYGQLNSWAPERFQFNCRWVIFKLILLNGGWGISYEIALRWMPLNLTDDKSTLAQVMAWSHQATSHYLIQCWPSSMSPCMVSTGFQKKNSSTFQGLFQGLFRNFQGHFQCRSRCIAVKKYRVTQQNLEFACNLP